MRVLVDCDGVVFDLVQYVCQRLEDHGHDVFTPEDVKHYSLKQSFPESTHGTLDHVSEQSGECYWIPTYDGAVEFVDTLDALTTFYFVTAPWNAPTWDHERREAIQFAFGIPRTRVLSVPACAKHLVKGDLLIEDSDDNARRWLEEHPNAVAILVDRPWNRSAEPHPRMLRMSTYDEILSYVSGRLT